MQLFLSSVLLLLLLSGSGAFGLSRPSLPLSSSLSSPSPSLNLNPHQPLYSSVVSTDGGMPLTPASVPRAGILSKMKSVDIPLVAYFFFWYLGNYYYNITNKMALTAAGGKTGLFPMTVASMQMGVGCIYALLMWVVPDGREKPKITMDDVVKLLPVAFCSMGSHCASVFAMNLGAVSFAQIVKAAEPAFAAVLAQFVYGKKISRAKWMCLPIVIGGVVLSSVKELDFAWAALIFACIGNLFAAIKGNENKKFMDEAGVKDRLGSVGNQFAITTMLGFLWSIPLFVIKEGKHFGEFVTMYKSTPALSFNLIASGMWWYGYNELATMTIKKTNAVTQSVANTAKRVIVIVGCAIVFGEAMPPIKILGCAICIAGVFLYSIIDQIMAKIQAKKA